MLSRLTRFVPSIRANISCRSLIWASAYSTATPAPVTKDVSYISAPNRNTFKHEFSRKTFLVDYYTYLNRTNEIVLFVHHNNLTKTENKKIRADLSDAGAKLSLIRNSIYEIYLRSENELDPADKETSLKNKGVKHPLAPLLNGPTAVITIEKCDPTVVSKVLKVLKSTNEKLFLIGAKIDQQVFDIAKVDQFKDLPTKEQLQAQLMGTLTILGGSGLVQTLETPSKLLYLTGKELTKMQQDDKEN